MKKILLPFLVISTLFVACNNSDSRKISKVDKSITTANAYNNFFLDSSKLEAFIATEKLDTSIADKLRSFYYSRNFEFAWLAADGLTEQARGFWNLHSYYTTYNKDSAMINKKLSKEMNELNESANASLQASDKTTLNNELLLTQHFINYIQKNYDPNVSRRKNLESFVPKKKERAMIIAKEILDKKDGAYESENKSYKLLKDQLRKYFDIANKGGWQAINYTKTKLQKGTSSPTVALIKKRLQATGEMSSKDTSAIFDDALDAAVKAFQANYGYTATGIVTDSLIKDMNVSATTRIQQLIINLDRMRWLPDETDGRLIVTNIPEFKLHVYENNKEAFNMNVVVGKEGHSTVMFNGKLSQVVFSPYWNVPPSIVKNEMLSKIKNNSNYLAKNNMEQVGESNGLPEIRQKPGGQNSLGKVKFLFPNAFNIYFHDTPAKDLFKNDNRAYSHGCIRLSDPLKMANYLLQDDKAWDNAKIVAAMNAGTEKYVSVKKPVPVIITYYTAWVGDNGQLNLRNDIYAHDSDVAKKCSLIHYKDAITFCGASLNEELAK